MLVSHPLLGLPTNLFPPHVPTKILYESLTASIRATCPAHPILLDFIALVIFGEAYKF